MKACSRCGFYNTDERDRCLKCNAILEHDWGAAQQKVRLRRFPFHRVTAAVANAARDVRRFFSFPIPEECPRRQPWLAGFLSFLPGLGQIYNRQYNKAAVLFPVFVGLLWLVVVTIHHPLSYVFIGAFIAWILLAFNDSVVTAVKINGQEWPRRNSLALYSALIFYLGVFFSVSQFFLVGVFIGLIIFCMYSMFWPGPEVNKAKVLTTAVVSFGVLIGVCLLGRSWNPVLHKWVYWSRANLEPAIQKGDFIYVDCVTYWFRKPRVGDIVYYNPRSYSIKLGEDTYTVNLYNTIERVVALPGDVFGRDGDRFYRNGETVPPELQPLHPSGLPGRLEFKVPGNRYLVLITYAIDESMPLVGSRRAPSPAEGSLMDWSVCEVKRSEIVGRCLFIWHPIARRQMLTSKKQ